jgi:hypothetical protein
MEEIHGNSGPLPEQSGIGEDTSSTVGPLQPEGPALPKRRLGFMEGQYTVPDDIKTMFAEEIEEMFYGHRAQHKFDDIEDAMAERLRQEMEAKR